MLPNTKPKRYLKCPKDCGEISPNLITLDNVNVRNNIKDNSINNTINNNNNSNSNKKNSVIIVLYDLISPNVL